MAKTPTKPAVKVEAVKVNTAKQAVAKAQADEVEAVSQIQTEIKEATLSRSIRGW